MIGNLTNDQIEHVLRNQVIGRIGCYADKKIYVVPVTYVYDNGYVYAHSHEGLKIRMMRKHPQVCFESDTVDNMASWRSVIAWGEFEELKTDAAKRAAIKIMNDRLLPIVNSSSLKRMEENDDPPKEVRKPLMDVIYRIKLNEKTGRYEKPFLR